MENKKKMKATFRAVPRKDDAIFAVFPGGGEPLGVVFMLAPGDYRIATLDIPRDKTLNRSFAKMEEAQDAFQDWAERVFPELKSPPYEFNDDDIPF